MPEKKNMTAKEPYQMPLCRRCGGVPKLEYRMDFRVWVRCSVCDTHTAWAPTRWQAYEDWDDMQL